MIQRRIIHRDIETSLPQYDKWRMQPKSVGDTTRAFLEILSPALERYVDGLVSPEKEIVDAYLAGIDEKRIYLLRNIQKYELSKEEVRTLIWGTKDTFGLVNTMYKVFMRNANFCAFCHDRQRYGDCGIHPKLSGTICDHEARWEAERLKEEGKSE